MTTLLLVTLLFVTVSTALLSLLYQDLFVSVILLSVFSFLSALLFYVAHAPDVAITEAAVGAGITTFLFVWAVRATRKKANGKTSIHEKTKRDEKNKDERLPEKEEGAWGIMEHTSDILLALLTGVLLFIFLPSLEGGAAPLRDYFILHGREETGAVNLVSAIYLQYRAFDTFGETLVLLCAVSGSLFFLSSHKEGN